MVPSNSPVFGFVFCFSIINQSNLPEKYLYKMNYLKNLNIQLLKIKSFIMEE